MTGSARVKTDYGRASHVLTFLLVLKAVVRYT